MKTLEANKKLRRPLVCAAIFFSIIGRVTTSSFLFIAIILFIIAMLLGTDFENFEICLFLIPCIRLFDITGISFVVNLFLFFPILINIARSRKICISAFLHTGFLIIIELLHCVSLGDTSNIASNISAITGLYFCEILLYKHEYYNPINIFRWLSYGSIFSAICYLMAGSAYSRNLLNYINRGVRFEAFANDPNYYSMYICIAISCFFLCKSIQWHDIVIVLFDFSLCLLTYSKMSILVIILILGLYGFRQLSRIERNRNAYRVIILAIVITVILNIDRVESIFANIYARLVNVSQPYNIAALTTGRSTLLIGYIKQLLSNPIALIWGYGFAYVNHIGVAINANTANNVSHNTILDVFLSWGMIGAIAMIYIIHSIIHKGFDHNKHYGFYNKTPILCLLLCMFSLSCLSAGMFWYMVSATLLAVKYSIDSSDNENNHEIRELEE